jgi:hypothetical protein
MEVDGRIKVEIDVVVFDSSDADDEVFWLIVARILN